MSKVHKQLDRYRIEKGRHFRLKNIDPADTHGFRNESKADAAALLQESGQKLSELQDRLYAQDRWSVLLIFQAMDAAGKDGTIKHVMSGVNPQGCSVASFKAPSNEELDHDYLWRVQRWLPNRGHIGIFNRSYYEEVLVARVHPEILASQKLPQELVTRRIWEERYEDINSFERYLARNGTVIRKFFLHISKGEQKKRFLERLDEPEKNWKFSASDIRERGHWDAYAAAYEDMIRATASPHSPWFVVPADNKWYTRLIVGAAIVEALEGLNLAYPKVDRSKRAELVAARELLVGENK